MAFGYAFLDLTEEDKLQRRHYLDLYASIAQISAVVIIILLQARFLASWTIRRWGPAGVPEVPSSPYLKHQRQSGGGAIAWLQSLRHFSHQLQWWAGEEMIMGWGTKGEWLGGAVWTFWLLFCCVNQTGQDYFHLTKRFGIVGASQLPFHYLLATKTPYSPLQILARSSHEQLNSIHQVLGRVITLLFSLHAIFYLGSFIEKGILADRLQERIIILGLSSIILFNLIGSTALGFLRHWSYRVFYATHVIGAVAVLPLLYFHVHHIRIFIWETLAIYVLHTALRFANIRKHEGHVTLISGTNLIKVEIPLPASKSARGWQPGQHVYLRIPHHHSVASTAMAQLKENLGLRSNPFTVSSLPQLDRKLVLVARSMRGNTKDLAELAHSNDTATVPLKLDGPYGATSWLPDFTEFDSILLVAGGVGATFIVPLWRSLCMSRSADGGVLASRVRFVWAVKRLPETTWAFPSAEASAVLPHATRGVEVYVTGSGYVQGESQARGSSRVQGKAQIDSGDDIELEEREHLMSGAEDSKEVAQGLAVQEGRPKLADIVTEAFAIPSNRVAVLVCGPHSMTIEMRAEVGTWVKQGRDVFWHAEAFGL